MFECEFHVCGFEKLEIKKMQLDDNTYSRENLISHRLRLLINIWNAGNDGDGYENFETKFGRLFILIFFSYPNSDAQKYVTEKFRTSFNENTEFGWKFFENHDWDKVSRECFISSKIYLDYKETLRIQGKPSPSDINHMLNKFPSFAHAHSQHLTQVVEACNPRVDETYEFIKNNPKNGITPALIKYVAKNDPEFVHKGFPEDWVLALYGVSTHRDHHLHLV